MFNIVWGLRLLVKPAGPNWNCVCLPNSNQMINNMIKKTADILLSFSHVNILWRTELVRASSQLLSTLSGVPIFAQDLASNYNPTPPPSKPRGAHANMRLNPLWSWRGSHLNVINNQVGPIKLVKKRRGVNETYLVS